MTDHEYKEPSTIDDEEDDEFLKFQKEIAELEGNTNSEQKDDNNTKDENEKSEQGQESINDELAALDGMKCKAPFEITWGRIGYYNAVVINVETTDGQIESLDSILLRVVFSNPQTKSMLLCSYFMDGKCKFSDKDCKFSHGEIVSLADLKEYEEPDFSKIETGSRVLAKFSDSIWYKGTVSTVNGDGECEVVYDEYNEKISVPLEFTFPIDDVVEEEEEDANEISNSPLSSEEEMLESEEEVDEDDDDEEEETADHVWVLQMKGETALGEWEKYTKGIGSKLMAKMGYVLGTGLGKNGEGRIEPVDAVVLPLGLSLDTCMELKEKAGNSDLFKADRKLKRQKKKEEERAKKAEIREQNRKEEEESMFNFLNNKLTLKKEKINKNLNISNKELSKDCNQSLNKRMLEIGENIKKVKKCIVRIRLSVKRLEGRDQVAQDKMKAKLIELEKELNDLQKSESNIASAQKNRRDKNKLTIF